MKNDKIKSLILLLVINLWSCGIKRGQIHETKQGSYIVNIITTASADVVVVGTLYDYDSRAALHYPRVQANNGAMVSGDVNGKFKMNLKPGQYRITGKGLPYQFVKTRTVVLRSGDGVELNFYLKPYNKPLH